MEINDFEGKTIEAIIEFIYTGKIDIDISNVLRLLGAANFLQVDDIEKICLEFCATCMTVDNCLDIMINFEKYNNLSYFQFIYQFISNNFEKIIEKDSFKELSKDQVMSLLSSVDRNTMEEATLYSAIINWVRHDSNRENKFLSLFQTLDFQKLPPELVADIIAQEPLVKSSKECLHHLVLYLTGATKDVKKQEKSGKLVCVGGQGNKCVLEVHNMLNEHPNIYPDLPYILSCHCSLMLGNCIYCFGGDVEENAENPRNTIFRLNLKTAELYWEEIAPMCERRSGFASAAWNGNLVVVGGYNGKNFVNSAEIYEPHFDRWRNIEPLTSPTHRHQLVVANNKLFAIGGISLATSSKKVQQLENINDQWKEIKPMLEPKCFFAAVA